MKDVLCVVLAITFFFAGCCGREGNPVQAYMPGDEKRSCESVCAEMSQAQTEIARLTPKANKTGYNTVMFVGGLFVIVPFFFMDFKNGDKVELQAYRQRYNSLALIAAQQGCVVADGGAKKAAPVAVPASN